MSDPKPPEKSAPPYIPTDRALQELLGDARSQGPHSLKENLPQQKGGGGAPGAGAEQNVEAELEMSEEARNQQRTGQKKITESGTP